MTFNHYKEKVLTDPRSKKLSFKPDGRNHYVYRVSHIHIGIHYYGSKTENRLDSIGIKYYTSSSIKSFQKDFKENREDYKVKVIRYFDNPGDKILFESYIHYKLDVKARYNFINQVNQTAFGFDPTGRKDTAEERKRKSDFQQELNNDPVRREIKAKKVSEASIKAQAEINLDPIKNAQRTAKVKQSKADIKNDPVRKEQLRSRLSRAATKSNAEIKVDPVRYAQKIKRMSENRIGKCMGKDNATSKIVYQLHPENGDIIKKWYSCSDAARECGCTPSNVSISASKPGGHFAKKFGWAYEENLKETQTYIRNKAKKG